MGELVDYGSLKQDNTFLVELPTKVWLMDNHKWALLAWEQQRAADPEKRYALIHADFHWDGGDDFQGDVQAQDKLMAADVEELRSMTREDKLIRYDSFIAPAVRRRALKELHFYCLQNDGTDEGIDAQLCEQMHAQQVLHADIASLEAVKSSPLIFDLCLDLFNREETEFAQGQLWTDGEVLAFIEATASHIQKAELVTVSLSFDYSGTADDTRHLASLVVPRILALRAADG